MKCSKCGAQLPDDSKFCFVCGEKVVQSHVCPHCNRVVHPNSDYCIYCGYKLDYNSVNPKKKKYLGYIPFVAVIFVVFAFFAIYFCTAQRSEEKMLNKIIEAEVGKQEDPEEILKLYHSSVIEEQIYDDVYEGYADTYSEGKERLIKQLEDSTRSACSSYKSRIGDPYTYSYKILKEETIINVQDDFLSLNEDVRRSIEVGKTYNIKVRLESPDGSWGSYVHTYTLYKINGTWYYYGYLI